MITILCPDYPNPRLAQLAALLAQTGVTLVLVDEAPAPAPPKPDPALLVTEIKALTVDPPPRPKGTGAFYEAVSKTKRRDQHAWRK